MEICMGLMKAILHLCDSAGSVFALRFQNLPAQNSSLKIFKHEKEKFAGLKGKLTGPAQFLVAEGLGSALNAKTAAFKLIFVEDKELFIPAYLKPWWCQQL